MAYDERLADAIRDLIGNDPDVTEKRMFGGLAFLVAGNMAIAASGQGGLLVRVDPGESAAIQNETGAEPMVMRGRPMDGWLRVDAAPADVEAWVRRGVGFARTLPPKSR